MKKFEKLFNLFFYLEKENENVNILIASKAPDFCAPAVLADGQIVTDFKLSTAIQDKYGLLFFYPLDFTFVCPSELIALSKRQKEFHACNVQVIGVSIDSHYTHHAWRNTPIEKGGIGQVNFPLVADIHHRICQAYGVEHPVAGVALRAAFLIDKTGIVRAMQCNDLPIGRNIDELLRLCDALQFHEQHGEVCPAGWHKGKAGMQASSQGVADYLANNQADL